MKYIALICLGWLGCILLACGVIQSGYLKFTPPVGAVSYSVWRADPGVALPQYAATITTNSYPLGVVPDGTRFWVKANTLAPNGVCCIESDYAFAVTEPQVEGTNTLRIVTRGPIKILQGTTNGIHWQDLAALTNPPVEISTQQRQLFRLKMLTNAPPAPGGVN